MKRFLSSVMVLASAFALLSSCDSSSNSSKDEAASPSGIPSDTAPYGIPWKSGIAYGSLTDARDGQVYRTVKIGTQRWMAQNLNYAGTGTTVGVCYGNSADSCKKYGRLYAWSELMNGSSSSSSSPSGVQGLCPTGWHVPSDSEWTVMQQVVDASNATNGTKLKSTSGWKSDNEKSGNGTDTYGFRALPGGSISGGFSYSAGNSGLWWGATERDWTATWGRFMTYSGANVRRDNYDKKNGLSARCLED